MCLILSEDSHPIVPSFLIVIALVIWTKTEGNTLICFQKNRLFFFAIALSLYQDGSTFVLTDWLLYNVLYAEVL